MTDPDRGGAWQATNLVEMARPITKYSVLVRQPQRVTDLMKEGLEGVRSRVIVG